MVLLNQQSDSDDPPSPSYFLMLKNNRPSKQQAVLHVVLDANQFISVGFDVPYSASVRLQTFETSDASEVTGQGGVRTVFAPVHMHSP